MRKVCGRCRIEKELDEFLPYRGYPDSHMKICRDCKREKDNEYSRERNKRDKEKIRERTAQWAANNREQDLNRKKKYNREHRLELVKKGKECRQRNLEAYRLTAREHVAERRATDMNFRLKDVLRKRMRNALLGLSKASRTMELIGCSIDELKGYLEKQFVGGMNWENYGKNGWHIDHIIPCCSFDLTKGEEQRKCFHYTNLRPLWAVENWAKSAQDRKCVAA